jgi:hypothetical protein
LCSTFNCSQKNIRHNVIALTHGHAHADITVHTVVVFLNERVGGGYQLSPPFAFLDAGTMFTLPRKT